MDLKGRCADMGSTSQAARGQPSEICVRGTKRPSDRRALPYDRRSSTLPISRVDVTPHQEPRRTARRGPSWGGACHRVDASECVRNSLTLQAKSARPRPKIAGFKGDPLTNAYG